MRVNASVPGPATSIDSLPEDLLAEILLLLPSPAALARAALGSRRWQRVACGAGFLARYRAAHPSRPLLGLYVSRAGAGHPSFELAARPVRADAALGAFVRGGDFYLTRLGDDPEWRLLDCHNGRRRLRLLLSGSGSGDFLAVYDPVSGRGPVRLPRCDPLLPGTFAEFLLPGHGDDADSFRVVFVQHRGRMIRAAEYDADAREWHYHRWVNCIDRPEQGQVMRAGGFVFWRYEDSTSLLLDTSTMEFDILHLPFAFFQPAKYAIGEIEDGVCCLVGLVGGMYNLLLQVWLLKEKDGVAKKWMLDKSVPLSEVLGRHDRVCQVRVVNNGLALLCWDEHSTHFVIDLNTLCLKAMFVCNGIAYPVQMPWPSVVLMAAVSEFVPSKMNRATDVAACSRGRLDLVLGLDGPCDKRKTMAAEAGNAVAAPDMGQVMAVETSNMGYDLLDTQFLPESNYSDVICCLDERCGFDQNELDVAAAPSLLLCHHKKLHIESNSTSCSQQSLSSTLIEDQQQSTSQHTSDTVHSAASASGFCPLNIISSTDGPLDRDNASCTKHSSSSIRELSTAERTVTPGCTGSSIGDVNITSMQFSDQNEPYAGGDKPCSNFSVICSSRKSEESDLSINIPQDKMFDALNDKSLNIDEKDTEPVSNLVPEMNEYPIGRATPTSPKTNRQWNRFISISRTFGSDSKSLPEDLKLTGFACHSKKPQTQISYSVSHRREDLGIKHNGDYCKMQSHSSAKTNDTKRLPQNSRSGHSSSESLTCVANVLVTVGDRGWREYNTHITVDSDDQSEQRICVELAKGIKYAHKVCEALQRGVTNRYTRAMIWKGGAEWCLEFPDKGQWLIFKQMHDECYSHNIRTASVKKIPIPGVHLVEGHDDNDAVSFVRSQDHLCHIGTDVELALNESCVIYDMDSDDEEWITSQKKPLVGENTAALELTEDLFEKIMDKLERFAYSHNSSMLTIDQMKELDTGNVPLDIIKIIHTYWQDKRQKKGMPLIRHFQRW